MKKNKANFFIKNNCTNKIHTSIISLPITRCFSMADNTIALGPATTADRFYYNLHIHLPRVEKHIVNKYIKQYATISKVLEKTTIFIQLKTRDVITI